MVCDPTKWCSSHHNAVRDYLKSNVISSIHNLPTLPRDPLKWIEVRWGEKWGIVVISFCPLRSKKVEVIKPGIGYAGSTVDAALLIPTGEIAINTSKKNTGSRKWRHGSSRYTPTHLFFEKKRA